MQINEMARVYLTSPVMIDEIKKALFSIDDAKSPDPNGYSFKFYKLHWIDP